jgi:predicted transcriptional regulator
MKNPKPRGNMEIKKEILIALKEGETVPTRIQQRVNLSYMVLQSYLSSLKNNGLVMEFKTNSSNSKRFHYSLTEKGEDCLKVLQEMHEIMDCGNLNNNGGK